MKQELWEQLIDESVGLDAACGIVKHGGHTLEVMALPDSHRRGKRRAQKLVFDRRMVPEWQATGEDLVRRLGELGYEYYVAGAGVRGVDLHLMGT